MATTASASTYLQPYDPTKRTLKTGAQAAAIQQALALTKQYRTRDTWKASIAIAQNYLMFACCIATVEWTWEKSQLSAFSSKAIYLLSILIIASRMRAMENLVHEASHNNLFISPGSHQRLQFLYAFPVFRVLQDYRQSHMIHHKYLGDLRKDPDVLRLHDLGLHRLRARPMWCLFGLPMTGYLTYEYLTTTFWEFWGSPSSRWSKLAYWVAIMVAVWWTDTFQHFACYYLVPLLTILPVIRYWAEAAEHLGLDLREDFGSSRSNIGLLHMWFMNPHNDGYHAAHHLCSQIPFHLLPKAHHHLMKASTEFAATSVISHGLYETFRQVAFTKTTFKEVARPRTSVVATSVATDI